MSEQEQVLDRKLIERLRSKKVVEREAAERALLALGPAAVDSLLKALEAEVHVRKRNQRLAALVGLAWIVFIIVLAACGVRSAGGMAGSMSGAIVALMAATAVQKNAAGALARYEDKRAVGPLAEALEYQDKNVVAAVRGALTRLLPTLQAGDRGLLDPRQRRVLDRALVRAKQPDLSLAILRAYEQVGDRTSIAVVEKLAAGGTRAARDLRVVELAREVLPGLKESAEMVHAAQTLLRPAQPSVGSDTLLRPLTARQAVGTATLVRPVDAESAEAVQATHADRSAGSDTDDDMQTVA